MPKTIDNFRLIKPFIKFPTGDEFYAIHYIQRRKDPFNEKIQHSSVTKGTVYIRSLNELESRAEEIRSMSRYLNARAYINPTPYSKRRTAAKALSVLSGMMMQDGYDRILSLTDASKEFTSDRSLKRWIVDLDNWPDIKPDEAEDLFRNIAPADTPKVLAVIPSVTGSHLMTRPFDLRQFSDAHMDIDVHKEGLTLLYFRRLDDGQ